MERIISAEERIRRAEMIAARRYNRVPISNLNREKVERKKLSKFAKFSIQILISIVLFGIIYFLNQNNFFLMNNIKSVMNNDTDFNKLYADINNVIKSMINENEQNNEVLEENASDNSDNNEENDTNIGERNVEQENSENQGENKQNEAGVGGGNDGTEISQTEDDVTYIKNKLSFIKPISGVITSTYGQRTPTEVISANHAGVDIGCNEGTDIVAAIEGIVELVSSTGDYGKHIKVTNGDVSTLYAHCSKITVNQGDYITQGQKIAEVGSTGRATGPHLHFEIRRNNTTVDPQKIVSLN